MRHTRSGAPRGFTIIEILVAVFVSAVGFAAVFSLQIGTMQGNISARETAAAMNLAERYAERLRAEAYEWTGSQLPGPRLNQPAGAWATMTDIPAGQGVDPRDGLPVDQNGLPHQGADPNGSQLVRQRFCVHYWLSPLDDVYDGILNARVRVIWPRDTLNPQSVAAVCTQQGAAAFQDNVGLFSSVTIPVTVRRHPR